MAATGGGGSASEQNAMMNSEAFREQFQRFLQAAGPMFGQLAQGAGANLANRGMGGGAAAGGHGTGGHAMTIEQAISAYGNCLLGELPLFIVQNPPLFYQLLRAVPHLMTELEHQSPQLAALARLDEPTRFVDTLNRNINSNRAAAMRRQELERRLAEDPMNIEVSVVVAVLFYICLLRLYTTSALLCLS